MFASIIGNSYGYNMDVEIWKDMPEFEGYYQISNYGRVKSLPRIVRMIDGRKYTVKGKILGPAWDGHYYHVIFSKGKEFVHLLHRLVLTAFVGPAPEGMEGCHNDGNPKNNRLDNLRWDSSKNNYKDKIRHGTDEMPKGKDHWNVTLDERQVLKIRRIHALGRLTTDKKKQLMARYEISETTVRDICMRRSWKHI